MDYKKFDLILFTKNLLYKNMSINIIVKDGLTYNFKIKNIFKSNIILSILGWDSLSYENLCEDDIPTDAIKLNEIDFNTLRNIELYLDKHDSNEIDLDNWDLEFINKFNDDELFNIIMGANYLDINSLLDLGCKTVADQIKKCKTPHEIRKRFNIKNDFTPEEEAEIKKENIWLD